VYSTTGEIALLILCAMHSHLPKASGALMSKLSRLSQIVIARCKGDVNCADAARATCPLSCGGRIGPLVNFRSSRRRRDTENVAFGPATLARHERPQPASRQPLRKGTASLTDVRLVNQMDLARPGGGPFFIDALIAGARSVS